MKPAPPVTSILFISMYRVGPFADMLNISRLAMLCAATNIATFFCCMSFYIRAAYMQFKCARAVITYSCIYVWLTFLCSDNFYVLLYELGKPFMRVAIICC